MVWEEREGIEMERDQFEKRRKERKWDTQREKEREREGKIKEFMCR